MAENAHQHPRSAQLFPMRFSLRPAAFALMPASLSLILSTHYPMAPTAMSAAMLVILVAHTVSPHLWLLILPALLPVVGLAPWSGWITFEELDILVLAVAAGGYARLAWPGPGDGGKDRAEGVWLLAGMFALATALSIHRGFADAGGFSFGWFQGYHEPMNSVRVGKSFFLALLLMPLWLVTCKKDAERSQQMLSMGLVLGLAAAALTTVWERAAFVDLMNFSADYRTTGLFWEMHVGGAALDGFLALTVPFALRELVQARTAVRWGLAAAVLGLATYACLTTFSRGVYLAVPVGVVAFFVLSRRAWIADQVRNDKTVDRNDSPPVTPPLTLGAWLTGILLVAGFGVGADLIFQSSGYRGMAALLGSVALMLPLAQVLRGLRGKQWALGLVAGLLITLAMAAVSWLVPKGAYVAWALAAVLTALTLWLCQRRPDMAAWTGPLALGGFVATVASVALVAGHWGGYTGLRQAAPVLWALLGVCELAGLWRKPLWPTKMSWHASTVTAMAFVAATIGVMGGGAYMGDRFSTGGKDLDARLAHWQLGRSILATPADWWLGKGLGRFPANFFLNGNPQQHPGDYRIGAEGGNNFLTITGGLQGGSEGEWLRVTQRVSEPGKEAVLTARVRADSDVTLSFEVCEKHLLYSQGCISKTAPVKGAPGVWQDVHVVLQGAGATRGAWYAPRLLTFSVAMGTRGGKANLDNVTLTATGGQQLLANGDFSNEMAHWFSSSDRNHLPWHIKSLYMNVLFDMGLVGLALWLALFAAALWRLSMGQARTHPIAPALAAGLVGFAVVGLFDSLLDVPRLAWLYYFMLLVALTLPPARVQRLTP